MNIPEEIKRKIEERIAFRMNQIEFGKEAYSQLFDRDFKEGAEYGYSLSLERMKEQEKRKIQNVRKVKYKYGI